MPQQAEVQGLEHSTREEVAWGQKVCAVNGVDFQQVKFPSCEESPQPS